MFLHVAGALEQIGAAPAAATRPFAGAASTFGADPIFAAIETHKKLYKQLHRLFRAKDEAECNACERHGLRPIALIAWRDYSHIGGSEIDRARLRFLDDGIDPQTVEAEYRDAKKRYRAKERAGRAWDKRAGTASLQAQIRQLWRDVDTAGMRMAKTEPITPAGAGALVAYAHADLAIGTGPKWPMPALRMASRALARMSS
jgi:hypothetical protein